jgi:hypothetical protein
MDHASISLELQAVLRYGLDRARENSLSDGVKWGNSSVSRNADFISRGPLRDILTALSLYYY